MHLRKAKVKGRVYLSIVQSYRTPDSKTRSKTIETIGYADALEDVYDDPIAHFEAEVERRNAGARAAGAPVIVKFSPAKKIDKRAEGRVELGAAVPSAYFHRDLGIWGFFERRRTARGFAYDPCRILELLVWNRIAEPASKRGAFEARGRFPRKCDFSLDDVYRSLTYLNARADELVKHMNEHLESVRGPRNKARLYYDVTNYYFEVENEDAGGLCKRGVSKEHRPSPIVQMGLFLDGDGLPLDYEVFAGSTNDMATMPPAMRKVGLRRPGGPESGRVIVVADKGLNTSNNIAAVTLDGNGFILSQSVRKATKELKGWALRDEGYEWNASGTFEVKSRIADKVVYVVGEDGRRRKVHGAREGGRLLVRATTSSAAATSARRSSRSRGGRSNPGGMSSAAAKTSVRYARGHARGEGDRRGGQPQLGARRGQDRSRRGMRRLLLHHHERAGDGRPRGHRGVPRAVEDRGLVPRAQKRL
jgi:hypothetical protein